MSSKFNLEFLSMETLNTLKAEFQDIKEHYNDISNEWFKDYFDKNKGLLESNIECEDFIDKLNMDSDYAISDYENIKIIFSALKELSPSVASDERLWSGLAHGKLWGFVKYRRAKELNRGRDLDIKNSFFITRGQRRGLYINCISRLWWAGYLTYDETREDPFELTKLLFEKAFSSTIMLFSSYNLVSRKETAVGIISGLLKIKEQGKEISRSSLITVLKYLNYIGSITILDVLEKDEIKDIVEGVLKKEFNIV